MLLQPSTATPARPVRTPVASYQVRPAVLLPVAATRKLLTGLANDGVHRGGVWDTAPAQWRRYDRPWGLSGRGDAALLGTLFTLYDQPTRYMTTLYRVELTDAGLAAGWTFERLCDDALWHAGLSLAECSRADLASAPRAFTEPVVRLS